MKSSSDLRSMLKNIDRKGYPAYKGTYGIYDFGNYYYIETRVKKNDDDEFGFNLEIELDSLVILSFEYR